MSPSRLCPGAPPRPRPRALLPAGREDSGFGVWGSGLGTRNSGLRAPPRLGLRAPPRFGFGAPGSAKARSSVGARVRALPGLGLAAAAPGLQGGHLDDAGHGGAGAARAGSALGLGAERGRRGDADDGRGDLRAFAVRSQPLVRLHVEAGTTAKQR